MPATYTPTKDEILDQLNRLSRDPFQQWTAEIIGALPTKEDMQAYFKKYPDRAAQTLTQVAKLSGYSEKTQINQTNIFAVVANASDAELMARLAKALEAIEQRKTEPVTIEQKPE
jgi:hypothetical protein